MRQFIHRHTISFKNAFSGLFWALSTQPNFKIHSTLSVLVLLLGWYVGISYTEYIVLIFTIVLGLGAEMINTSIEAMTDLITTQHHVEAKIAKDVAAGMMLLVAFGSVVVACFIFIPYFLILSY